MSTGFDADVVIIGYGPSGVSAANFLGARGVRTIALEREKDIYQRARAVTINDWTMRCFQSVGLAEELKTVMDETYALRWITYAGEELRRVVFTPGELGYAPSYSIYQPAMEQKLRSNAARYADHVEVRFGVDVTQVVQYDNGVTVTTTDLGTGLSSSVRAKYALACDGGSSRTREQMGIALLGDTGNTRWVVIDAKVKRWWPNRHILTFWSDRQRPVVDIALGLGNHRWEFPLGPDESESDFATHEQLWTLLATLGVTGDDVEIHRHAFYKHHVRSAERWREGRVLLVGDAVHLMPPWAGQGMQSGIRDAYNLAWKLEAIVAGRLSENILDTYQTERAPDVARCTMMSLMLGALIKREMGDSPPPIPQFGLPELQAGWVTGQPGAGNAIGKLAPQPRVVTAAGRHAMLDDVIGDGFVVLGNGVDPRAVLTAADRRGWNALGATYRAIRGPEQASEAADDLIDIDGHLAGWMTRFGARVVVLRPDRFVAAADVGGLSVPEIRSGAS